MLEIFLKNKWRENGCLKHQKVVFLLTGEYKWPFYYIFVYPQKNPFKSSSTAGSDGTCLCPSTQEAEAGVFYDSQARQGNMLRPCL